MTSSTQPLFSSRSDTQWARRRDIPIAILAWIAVTFIILWCAGHMVRTLIILSIAGLLAYALAPGVKALARFIPRVIAILIMYLIVLGSICVLLYFVTRTSIEQVRLLATNIQRLLTPRGAGQVSPLEQTLHSFGISSNQIAAFNAQLTSHLEGAAGNALPIVTGLFDGILDIILVTILSIYLLIDGSRISTWLRHNAPRPARASFVLDTVQRIVGGYIRGQLLLSTLIGVLVGTGMALFHVPYAVLLGVLAFILEFIPILGTLVSGAICTLLALTQGWAIAIGVLIYFIVVHVLEGDIIGPRIVGQAIGLHPIVSIAALVAGSELFGVWGALFASPVAGVLQALVIALWTNWRLTHPEHFEQVKEQVTDIVGEGLGEPSTSQQRK